MVNPQQQQQPLQVFDFFPVRLAELAAYFDGELSEAIYPKWVPKIAADFVRFLPQRISKAISINRESAIRGITYGLALAIHQKTIGINQEQSEMITRVSRLNAHKEAASIDVGLLLKSLPSADVVAQVQKEHASILKEPPASQVAYFEGFAAMLDLENEISKAYDPKNMNPVVDREIFKFYLWMRWPEIMEAGSIPAAYRKCVDAFSTTSMPDIVGSESAFKKFCNRYGISFASQQSRRRADQKTNSRNDAT